METTLVEKLNEKSQNTLTSHLGIVLTETNPERVKGTMPVDERTKQPFGLLHGGASAVLAETLGSIASSLNIDSARQTCVGLEINVNHIRGVSTGEVYGVATPLHLGRKTHVWEIKITNEADKLVAISRLTTMILDKD